MVKLIRKATLEDVPQLVSLAIQMWKSHTVEDLTKIFCEHIRKGKNFIFLAISEEHIVGFAQCGLRFDIVNIGLHFFHKDVRLYAASCSEV